VDGCVDGCEDPGAEGMLSKGLFFAGAGAGAGGGAVGGVCGCAGVGAGAGDCAHTAGQMQIAQIQVGITTRRRRLKNFMQAYLSTLRGYDDVETQATVSQLQLRFQRW
jgi:hypothetical protein